MYMELKLKDIKKPSFMFQLDKQVKELGAQTIKATQGKKGKITIYQHKHRKRFE